MLTKKEANKALFPLLEIIYELYKKDLKTGKLGIEKYAKPVQAVENLTLKFDQVFNK